MKSKPTIDDYGTKRWVLDNGELHREDGPAVEWSGKKEWYLNDKMYSEQEYKHQMRLKKLKHIL